MFTANIDFGPGSFNLEDPTVGLSDLSSYKATLKLSFDGTYGNQPNQWSRTYVMLSSQEPAAHQITIETTGGTLAPVFMAEVNGVTYERKGENPCTAATTEEGSSLSARWEPAGFLSSIIGADAAGAETINGVPTTHYTFDERALGQAGLSQSTGQMWVASDKGFLVRYLLTTKSDAAYFGDGIEGTLTWEYNLTDLNQPVLVKLPVGCPGGLVDAPLAPNAQSIRRLPGVTIYSIATSLTDGLAFYQKQLPELGWKMSGTPSVSDTMGLASFVKGDQQLSVIVTSAENMVEVRLVIGAAPKPMVIPGLP
jgi:hypothetical protein